MNEHLRPLPPGSSIGILGGGQLGRMLALAAAKIGLKAHIYTDRPDSPAGEVAAAFTTGAYDDLAALEQFAATVDVVTFEFENVPYTAARHLESLKPVRPGAQALAIAQDRMAEKQFLRDNAVPVAPFAAVDTSQMLTDAARDTGLPAILKTRILGYDGKGQTRITAAVDLDDALARIGGQPAILEALIPFTREISIIAVRGAVGPDKTIACRFYDCPANTHEDGVLRRSVVPAPISSEYIAQARQFATTILEQLNYIGVLAVEFFHLEGDKAATSATQFPALLVNEIAPRVHNSGHWTMDACVVDQFENHIRAVAGWPLGTTARHSDVEMINLIGNEIDTWRQRIEADDATSVHIYGKGEASDGRKMGHVNTLKSRSAR